MVCRTEIWESREDTTGRCDQSSGTFRGDQRGVLLGQMGIVKNHVLLQEISINVNKRLPHSFEEGFQLSRPWKQLLRVFS